MSYKSITISEAKEIFKTVGNYIICDVRRPDEYVLGHIPHAVNVPLGSFSTEKVDILPDLNQVIYVYCRSGARSKIASQILSDIGYTNIIECGGILDWTGDIEK